MLSRRGLMAAGALALLAEAGPARAEAWRIGPLGMTWLEGFVRLPRADVAQFTGPGGVAVTVDVLGHGPMSATEENQAVARWRSYAQDQLMAVARRHGRIVLPLSESSLTEGRTLYRIGCQGEANGRFGLLFLLVFPHGEIAQVVVEGPGDVADAERRFRPAVETGQWAGP